VPCGSIPEKNDGVADRDSAAEHRQPGTKVNHELIHGDATDERVEPAADRDARTIRGEAGDAIGVAQSNQGERGVRRRPVAVAVGDPRAGVSRLHGDYLSGERHHRPRKTVHPVGGLGEQSPFRRDGGEGTARYPRNLPGTR
jgi:hypothetical protein